MNVINIRDLMDKIQDSSVPMHETQVVSADRIKELTKMKLNLDSSRSQKRRMRTILVAVIAVLLLSGLGCTIYVIHEHNLKSLALQSTATTETHVFPALNPGETSYVETFQVQTISLQGFDDSPERLATMEWEEFLETYDPDKEILYSVGNGPTQWDEKYCNCGYMCYSQEMADKIEEIIAKYDLTLHPGPLEVFETEEVNSKYGPVMKDATYVGYYYPDGTFSLDGDLGEYGFQIHRSMKGVFDPIALNIGNIEDYEEWEYETSEGFTVLLAISEYKALIIADLDDAFVSVNVLLNMGDIEMSKEDLENMADHLTLANL